MSGKRDDDDISTKDHLPYARTMASDSDDWSEEHGPVLADQEVVAGRYRVVRYIARGGMGEVYEAEDLELGERVALKTIRERAKDDVSEERFKREIQLSRKVTHPNVCRIFDVGFYDRKGGDRVVFLTMELLVGETLLERIRRDGALGITEATNIVRQVVAGLSAAHAVRVIHRDLKSANVLLVPRAGGGVRAVVTDFGLAHVASDETRGRSLSGTGGIVGTPGYMAPEQVIAGEISERTDVYALGVVMYEMVTGNLPFDGTSPMSVATKRLTSPAPSPKTLRPELPAKWERAVLACLERAPSDRPQSARAVLALLGAITDSLEDIDGTIRIPKPPRRLPLVRPALVLCMIVALLVVGQRLRRPSNKPPQATVATLPFTPVGTTASAESGLGSIAAETMVLYLGGGPSLRMQGISSVTTALQDVGVPSGAQPTASQLDQLRAALSVDYFIMGRFALDDDGHAVIIDAELIDAKAKRRLVSAQERGTVDLLTDPLHRLGQRLAIQLGVKPGELGAGVGFTLPHKASTLRAFMEARELMARDENKAAVVAAQRAVAEEPDYARVHLQLARAHQRSGYERAAIEQAKLAAKLAAVLPRHERLSIEGLANSLAGDHAAAISQLEVLHAEIPNDEETSMLLSEELADGGRAADALSLVAKLRQMPVSPEGKQRLDLVEATVAEAGGDFESALRATQRALISGEAVESKSARARARYSECRLLDLLKRTAEARAACEESRRIASELGMRRLRAQAINIIAWLDFSKGELDEAQRAYDALLEVYRDTGDASGESSVLNSLASIASARGDRDRARKLYEEGVRMSDLVEDVKAGATPRQNLSDLAAEDGDLPRALALAEAADRAFIGSGEPIEIVSSMCRIAFLYLRMGRGRDVERKMGELEALQAQLVSAPPSDTTCDDFQIDLASGRNQLDKSVNLARNVVERAIQSADDSVLLTSRILLGDSLLERGDRAKAAEQAALAAPLAKKFAGWGAALDVAVLQLRVELAGGPVPDVATRIKSLTKELEKERVVTRRIQLLVELVRASARVVGVPRAAQQLRALAGEAMRTGLVSLALEAELYAFEVSADAGRRPSATDVKQYAQRARDAARPGWAERAERTLERGR